MILSITQNGQLWSVRFPYDADVVTACKMLNGHWHATDKAWKFARAEDVDLLRGESVFATSGADLLQRVRARKIERAGFRIDPSLPLSPDGLSLLPFQVDAVKFIAQRESSLLALPTGTGKTIVGAGTINAAPDAKKILIVCPANLKSNWYGELKGVPEQNKKGWLLGDRTVGIVSGSYWPPTNIVIINYDVLDRHKDAIDDILWDIAILDEQHFIKSPRAIRTKAIIGGKKGQKIWQPIRAHRKIGMSATPLVNKPMEIWAVLNWLDPKNWPSSYWFGKKYAGGHQGPFGWVADGATNLEDLNRRLRSTVMLRKTKAELLPDLPPKYRQVIEFDLPSIGSIIRAEQSAVESARAGVADLQAAVVMARVNKDEGEYREAVNRLKAYMRQAQSHIARARKNLAVAKVPYVVDHLRNALLDPDKKIIVFAHHRAVIESLFNQLTALKMQPVRLYGGMTQEDKNKAVETFQLDKNCRVFIGSITAAGVGLTLTAADHVVFAELDWVPGNVSQCEDRSHRIGQKSGVLVQHLVASGSLDAKIAKRLIEKQEILDAVLDGTSPLDALAPINWLLDHEEDADLSSAITEDALSRPVKPQEIAPAIYGLRSLVDRPRDFGVSDVDLILASRLVGRPLEGRPAAMARHLMKKYLDRS